MLLNKVGDRRPEAGGAKGRAGYAEETVGPALPPASPTSPLGVRGRKGRAGRGGVKHEAQLRTTLIGKNSKLGREQPLGIMKRSWRKGRHYFFNMQQIPSPTPLTE